MHDIQQKIEEIKFYTQQQPASAITIDLMMDRTRELYDLLIQKKINLNISTIPTLTTTPTSTFTEVINISPAHTPSPQPEQKQYTPLPLSPLTESLLKPKKDLRTVIGINDKYQIIAELFRHDKHSYEEAINTLNELEDMEEANLWMDNTIKVHYQWAEQDETLKLFMDTLNHFYLKHS